MSTPTEPTEPEPSSAAAAAPAPAPGGLGQALAHPVFRGLWLSSGLYFIANAMHTMAAAWLMVELSGSSFLAALVQTAVFLPMFVLSLPAGVLADTTDRGRLILSALAVQAVALVLLAVLMLAGWGGPATVLLLTFVAGCCTAVLSPAWNSSVGEVLPREQLPQAIVSMSIAYNGARALGPALAGLVYGLAAAAGGALIGAGTVFAMALAGTAVMAWAFRRWPPKAHPESRLPPERLWAGTVTGARYAWHSHTILSQLVRTAAFSAAGAALWALLPVIGAQRLGLGAEGFGFLMACLGGGAVVAGLVIARVRQGLGLERLVAGAIAAFGAVMLVTALSRWAWPVYAALVVGGGAWMSVMSTFNTATQSSAPPWVRSRATALHVLSALGPFALGSALWGAVSALLGLQATLLLATALVWLGLLLARRFPLRMSGETEVTQVAFEDLLVKHQPPPEAGPVAVEFSYRLKPEAVDQFLADVQQLKAPRHRDGATFWRIYRDLDEPARCVERFIVSSWADYLRQRARSTMADRAQEEALRQHLLPGEQVVMKHYLAER
ncbi:MAG: MFS transporter [Burkholderiaceae bacterium]|nr:MFS transporter [Burkholderiaceae bacterium]